jgi:hypothetical protein
VGDKFLGHQLLLIQKLGVPGYWAFALISISFLVLCYLRTKKKTTPLGLSRDCLPRLDSGVRVSNRFRVWLKSLGLYIVPLMRIV